MGVKQKGLMAVLAGIAVLLMTLCPAFAYDKLFIVGNQAAIDLAKDFFTTLSNESIPLAIITDQFEKIKNEKFIFILGGAKGPGGVDDLIKQVLSKEELASSNQPGGRMFVKENVFSPGQTIVVFTGSDEAAAAAARKSGRKTWWPYLVQWFELDTSSPMAY